MMADSSGSKAWAFSINRSLPINIHAPLFWYIVHVDLDTETGAQKEVHIRFPHESRRGPGWMVQECSCLFLACVCHNMSMVCTIQ